MAERPSYRNPRPTDPLPVYNAKRTVNEYRPFDLGGDVYEALDDLLRWLGAEGCGGCGEVHPTDEKCAP